jgi:predicted nucleic-acid-binding Zn-ribbon protein
MADKKKSDEDLELLEELKELQSSRPDIVCPKCQGAMTDASFEILNVIQADFGHSLFVGPKKRFYLNPNRRSQVNVYVCSKCGFIELYADDPTGL